MLQHCWLLLKVRERWRLRGNEAPPKNGAFVNLKDDDDSDDAPKGGRNKGKPDGTKKDKERVKRSTKASNFEGAN